MVLLNLNKKHKILILDYPHKIMDQIKIQSPLDLTVGIEQLQKKLLLIILPI